MGLDVMVNIVLVERAVAILVYAIVNIVAHTTLLYSKIGLTKDLQKCYHNFLVK